MPVPERLKKLPIWTISNPEKVPLDAVALFESGREVGFSKDGYGSELYDYDTIKRVQKLYPEHLMTIRASKDHGFTIVDIEPEGMMAFNPYHQLNYVYLERSSSDGRHGILDYIVDEIPHIVKDDEMQTEFFSDNHFTIITEREVEIPESKYILHDFIRRLEREEVETFEFEMQEYDIPERRKESLKRMKVKKYTGDTGDASKDEFKYLVYLSHQLHKKYYYTDYNVFLNDLMYLSDIHLPYREKHMKTANYNDVGVMTWRQRTLIKASQQVYAQYAE